MADFLAVPEKRRDRATPHKARSLRRGDLKWIRSYVADLDDELFGEPATVRFLDDALLRLAASSGWIITADPRVIAGRVGLRPGRVKVALDRLVELGRFERIEQADRLPDDGSIQLRLPPADQPPPVEKPVVAESWSGSGQVVVEQWSSSGSVAAGVSAQIAGSLESALENASTREEQEQRREKSSTNNGTAPSYAAALANADQDERELVNRLIGIACRGDTRSAGVIRYECLGLPDALVARALESYLARHPRPRTAGYVVKTLRNLRVESGLRDTRPRIEREPEL